MRIAVVGGGPGGLFAGTLIKRSDPAHEVTVFERNRAEDTFGFGVVFSDATLAGIHAADPVLQTALTGHGVHWDAIEVRLHGKRHRCGGNGMAAVERRTLLALLQRQAAEEGVEVRFSAEADVAAVIAAGYDLVIAADGANSRIRERYRDVFGPSADRGRQVHLARHHLPVRWPDIRPREGPARRVRRARVPHRQRRLHLHRRNG